MKLIFVCAAFITLIGILLLSISIVSLIKSKGRDAKPILKIAFLGLLATLCGAAWTYYLYSTYQIW